jgi:hypothetical protein
VENNPYSPPQANLTVEAEEAATLYVVSTRKFWVLQIATMGLYQLYWFYRNWTLYKELTNSSIWPVPRAIFSIFFARSLNTIVDKRIKRQQLTHQWSPDNCAFIFIVFAIMGNVSDRMAMKEIGSPISDFVALAVMPICGWALWQTQRAINVASSDADGTSNNTFTIANYVWIGIGALLWAAIIYGLYMIFQAQALS